MDINYILIILSLLIIFSYLFDAFARKTKFPSVILLMATGIFIRAVSDYFGYNVQYLDQIIPIMGTIGLVLIVLEGALELQVNKNKIGVIIRGFSAALIILIANVLILYYAFKNWIGLDPQVAYLNAIPLSIISSAVAIPSASALIPSSKEFIVYESTFSDILGIMLFNFALKQFESGGAILGFEPIFILGLEIGGIIIASIIITFLLFELLDRLDNQKVKFFLILSILVLVYAVGKKLHFPSLVIVFIFGLLLANSKTLLPEFLRKYVSLDKVEEGLHEFHILTAESTFIVRTFFFLFFGFSIALDSFIYGYNYLYSSFILIAMFIVRFIYMLIVERSRIGSLVFISPRGLISILLFLQLQNGDYEKYKSTIINERVLLLVILGSMLIMLIGTIGFGKGNYSDFVKEQNRGPAADEVSSLASGHDEVN